jgi:hypothetical protein
MAAGVNNLPFFRGEHVTLKFYLNGASVLLNCTNWTVETNHTEIAEGINGENRDRLDIVLNYYQATFDVNQNDQTVMNALIADQDNEDAGALPLPKSAAILIRQRDGQKAAYVMTGDLMLGPWSKNMSGRPDPVKLNCKMRFTKFSAAPTI